MSASTNKVLLVDDDIELTTLVAQYLRANDFLVECLNNGDDVEKVIEQFAPNIVVLDLMLPGTSGLTICQTIRPNFHGAIIMLTALGDEIDEVTGLEVGADDYLAKPVKPRVLLAHIRAQLRRHNHIQQLQTTTVIACNDQQLIIDASKRTVHNQGQLVTLSSAEFDLLWLLAQDVGQIVKREQLHEKIFKLEYDGIDRSIDLRISRIRKKLDDNPKEPQIIKTVRNVGYLLAS
ncbi:response regulator [Thalassotalea fusca]